MFLVIATEEFWNALSYEEVAKKVKELGKGARTCVEISHELTRRAYILKNTNDISVMIVEISTPDFFENWKLEKPSLISPPLSEREISYFQTKFPETILTKNEVEKTKFLILPIGKITKNLARYFPSLRKHFIRDIIPTFNRRIYEKTEWVQKKLQQQFDQANTKKRLNANQTTEWENPNLQRESQKGYLNENLSPTFQMIPYIDHVGLAIHAR